LNWTGPNKTRVVLATAILIPIGVLAWLGAKILQQESDVERQRARETLEVAAERLALAIDRRFGEIELQIGRGGGLHLTPNGIEGLSDLPVLYQPPQSFSLAAKDTSHIFAAAEVEEFKNANLEAAMTAYEKFAGSPDVVVRAGGLLRLARVLRKRGDAEGALAAYAKLEEVGPVLVSGDVASLLAREGRAKVFQETGRSDALRQAADDLGRLLYAGNLPIERTTFAAYSDFVRDWGGAPPPADVIAYTDAAIDLWQSWRSGELAPKGRRVLRERAMTMLAIWMEDRVWLASAYKLQEFITPLADAEHLHVSVSDVDGEAILGDPRAGTVSIAPAESTLPFILRVAAIDTAPTSARMILVSGLALAFLLMAAAAVTLYLVTARELRLAQQQSDFVSAVSHEFRTPLTSMRHLTELLVSRAVTSEERRGQYYELLSHETERLHRMVESLLSFGRIEAGGYGWRLEAADVGKLVQNVVEEFRREPDSQNREIVYEADCSLPLAKVDRDALSRALWNLLENAAKYSETGKPIRVCVRHQYGSLFLHVQDQGVGVPLSEREKIFQKFVRGAAAKQSAIRGVGIGLALVKYIAEAHGGTVRLESEPGRGSTFIVVIPCHEF
jgi:signal transduction histidine kinase